MKDNLGDRMKTFYENRTRYELPRRAYTLIRIDGKAFHTYTRGLKRPFDQGLMDDMDATTKYLCENIQGAKLGYVQSDEISILITDFETLDTDMWFDGNIQKMCSVSASFATSKFNQLRIARFITDKMFEGVTNITSLWIRNLESQRLAEFDARVFQIPSRTEVENYFIWREKDATRNSISSVAQSLYSHKELNGKSTDEMQEMIFQKGINWNDYSAREKRGGVIVKVKEQWVKEKNERGPGKLLTNDQNETVWSMFMPGDVPYYENKTTYERSTWKSVECPIFTQDRNFLGKYIPDNL